MKKFLRRLFFSVGYLATFGFVNYKLYSTIEEVTFHRAHFIKMLQLPIDRIIPLTPFFVWAYISLYLIILAAFFVDILPKHFYANRVIIRLISYKLKLKISRKTLKVISKVAAKMDRAIKLLLSSDEENKLLLRKSQTIIAFFLVAIVSSIIYLIFPLIVHRPAVKLTGSLSAEMLRFVWRTDLPDNTLPSQHTAFSILAFLIINRLVNKPIIGAWMIKLRKKIYTFYVSFSGGFFLIWAIFIILSIMFIKQHLFIDLIAGIIVSYFSYRIAFSKLIEKNLQRIKFLTKY